MHGGVYKRRTPEKSDLYKIAFQHFEEYEKVYPERYEEEYGYYRKVITATICKYLDCGIMENGFARIVSGSHHLPLTINTLFIKAIIYTA